MTSECYLDLLPSDIVDHILNLSRMLPLMEDLKKTYTYIYENEYNSTRMILRRYRENIVNLERGMVIKKEYPINDIYYVRDPKLVSDNNLNSYLIFYSLQPINNKYNSKYLSVIAKKFRQMPMFGK